MPYFNKSKGFQLRSGNKANAPFKMMGSSPAKQSASFGTILGNQKIKIEDPKKDPNSTVEGVSEQAMKGPKTKKETLKKGGITNATKENKPKEKTKSATELAADKAAKKAAKKEKRAQGFRDAGEIISNVGDPNTSMSSVIQGQADRRTAKADKAIARKDKDIQNEKDIANTKRTNQVVAEHTAKLDKDSSKLSEDNPSANPTGESSAEKVKNKKTTNISYADGNDSYTTPDEMLKKSRKV